LTDYAMHDSLLPHKYCAHKVQVNYMVKMAFSEMPRLLALGLLGQVSRE
jgi:hypothetical protein